MKLTSNGIVIYLIIISYKLEGCVKKTLIWVILILLTVPAIQAGSVKWGVGASGGIEFPIVQQDQKQGTVFGFKAKLGLIPALAIEPNLYFIKFGDPELEDLVESDLEGAKLNAYGIDAILGSGFGGAGIKPYGLLGIGSYKFKHDQSGVESTNFGWSVGFGIEIGVTPKVGLDFRGRTIVVSTEGGGSRKSAAVTGGINFYPGI